ncbi:MAG TPA: GNAT family N-acetyltransferase [Mycobacteriales bacterium]|nr:GNAT family N-acetyltransferase [Mycobacteriales bacterium]
MRVEVLGPDDWARWRDLRLEALQDTPIGFGELHADAVRLTDEEWRTRWTRPGLRAIAYGEQGPLGMAGGFRDDEGRPILFGVYVRPAARGGGVLGALVDAVAAWAAPDPLVLDVHVDNHRARKAYEKLGFTMTGATTPGGGIDGRDLQQMQRA